MNFHIITIFPESFENFLNTSIIWKWIKNNLFNIELYKLNDFSEKNFKHVDSKAYWMHGQVISPEPLSKAINFVKNKININSFPLTKGKDAWKADRDIPVIYMSPSWDLLNQEKVEKYYQNFKNKDIIIICGHYEWIDQRIIEKYVDYEISIWEYVLTSWELSSQVLIDSLVRNIPEVLWNKQSLEEESFSNFFDRQKEHPVYTRPNVFEWMEVPKILTSWNHKNIEEWKINNLKK